MISEKFIGCKGTNFLSFYEIINAFFNVLLPKYAILVIKLLFIPPIYIYWTAILPILSTIFVFVARILRKSVNSLRRNLHIRR